MKEFRVNEYITLKLLDNKTEIYVNNQLFRQCKFLLINIPIEQLDAYEAYEKIENNLLVCKRYIIEILKSYNVKNFSKESIIHLRFKFEN